MKWTSACFYAALLTLAFFAAQTLNFFGAAQSHLNESVVQGLIDVFHDHQGSNPAFYPTLLVYSTEAADIDRFGWPPDFSKLEDLVDEVYALKPTSLFLDFIIRSAKHDRSGFCSFVAGLDSKNENASGTRSDAVPDYLTDRLGLNGADCLSRINNLKRVALIQAISRRQQPFFNDRLSTPIIFGAPLSYLEARQAFTESCSAAGNCDAVLDRINEWFPEEQQTSETPTSGYLEYSEQRHELARYIREIEKWPGVALLDQVATVASVAVSNNGGRDTNVRIGKYNFPSPALLMACLSRPVPEHLAYECQFSQMAGAALQECKRHCAGAKAESPSSTVAPCQCGPETINRKAAADTSTLFEDSTVYLTWHTGLSQWQALSKRLDTADQSANSRAKPPLETLYEDCTEEPSSAFQKLSRLVTSGVFGLNKQGQSVGPGTVGVNSNFNKCPYFPSIDLARIHENAIDIDTVRAMVEQRSVMLGTSLFRFSDHVYSPLKGKLPGVTTHAAMLQNLLDGEISIAPTQDSKLGREMSSVLSLLKCVFYFVFVAMFLKNKERIFKSITENHRFRELGTFMILLGAGALTIHFASNLSSNDSSPDYKIAAYMLYTSIAAIVIIYCSRVIPPNYRQIRKTRVQHHKIILNLREGMIHLGALLSGLLIALSIIVSLGALLTYYLKIAAPDTLSIALYFIPIYLVSGREYFQKGFKLLVGNDDVGEFISI